jgi:YidC/Oxa1 family membrane protein insertase
MEKRLILAFALTILVFIGFQQFQRRTLDQTAQNPAPKQVETQSQNAQNPAQAIPVEKAVQPANVSPEDTNATAQKLTVKGDLYQAVIDNRGALLAGWVLNQYKSGQDRVFEMITAYQGGENRSFPASLIFDDQGLTALANNEFYQVLVNGQPYDGKELAPPVTAVFKLKRGGLAIEKRFSFERDNYIVNLSTISQRDDKPIGGKFFLGQDIGPEREHILNRAKLGIAYYSDGKVHREGPPKNENEIKKIEGDVRWVGLDMQYFTMIAIPSNPISFINIQKLPVKARDLDGEQVDRDLLKVTMPTNGTLQYQLYIGPKKQSNLEAVQAAKITGVIDYGMFSILVSPLLEVLRWIYKYVVNYGYAIIILTLLLSLLLFPFRLKQMLSMKKMQVVQPKVKAIQDKYRKYKKTDPKRGEMNQEIMALYKEHNVNPLGGCLPLLLQMPLLFAFYALLAYSIELRQAPFIWWIHDLSIKDPYYVLPIVMGISSFISQKMTPMTPGTDPTQAKVMMLMPAIFTVMFINLSSGLNLYFLCSNIFQVGFQKITERWLGGRSSEGSSKS